MSGPSRYLCIHGHFYQPPRENPWLDVVEEQPSAAPFHDWNERVSAECYGPNGAARILDGRDRIRALINNYELISFNFGPTLLSWLETELPETYDAIRKADTRSRAVRSGFGNAVAQVYNHIIMPLASLRDKRTQVRWGVADFEWRFGRRPEGMWLAETAADTETLEVLAEEGIRFTILAPHQAEASRPLGDDHAWITHDGASIDPTRPYLCRLPSGRDITLFFYDGPISRSIAFEGALQSGDKLKSRLTDGFSEHRDWPQLLTVAVDGETFGHHSRFGEMALAYALDKLLEDPDVRLTNFAEFLSLHPPTWEARLRENTSWSCAHGVERWRSDCGCSTGSIPNASQAWRGPLREAMDWLKEQLDTAFVGADLFRDPWAARDAYLNVLLNDTPDVRAAFLTKHLATSQTVLEPARAWKALEMQRFGLLMFTSCAWFFDEISRIEPRQVLSYAARAIQLALNFDIMLETRFVDMLRLAPSNLPEAGDGGRIYQERVRPELVDLSRVVAHSAISAIASNEEGPQSVFSYDIDVRDRTNEHSAGMALCVGRVHVTHRLTQEAEDISYCVVHFGGHDFHCSVRGIIDVVSDEQVRGRVIEHFRAQSVTRLIRTIDESFGLRYYTLGDLFRGERRRVLYRVSDDTLRRTEEVYRGLYEENRQLMSYAREIDVPVLASFRYASSFILDLDIRRTLAAPLDDALFDHLQELAREAKRWEAKIDTSSVERGLEARLDDAMAELVERPQDAALAHNVERLLDMAEAFGVHPDLWKIQNLYWQMCQRLRRAPEPVDAARQALWTSPEKRRPFRKLGDRLRFHPDTCPTP